MNQKDLINMSNAHFCLPLDTEITESTIVDASKYDARLFKTLVFLLTMEVKMISNAIDFVMATESDLEASEEFKRLSKAYTPAARLLRIATAVNTLKWKSSSHSLF